MLAINHVTLATALVFAGSLYFDSTFFLPAILIVVATSLLPDIDHPKSEMSKLFPIVGRVFTHRGVTHSFLGVAGAALLGYYAVAHAAWIVWIAGILGVLGIYFLHKIVRRRLAELGGVTHGFFSKKQLILVEFLFFGLLVGFVVLMVLLGYAPWLGRELLLLAVMGYTAHLVGDFVTKEGIPLMWPAKKRFGLRLFVTGSAVESAIGVLLVFVNIGLVWSFCRHFGVLDAAYWEHYGVLFSTTLSTPF
jgi:membrane-bound metal-dependent hydrolase YbcI (DUF457 family)